MPCVCEEVECECKNRCRCCPTTCCCYVCDQLREHVNRMYDRRFHREVRSPTPPDESDDSESSDELIFQMDDIDCVPQASTSVRRKVKGSAGCSLNDPPVKGSDSAKSEINEDELPPIEWWVDSCNSSPSLGSVCKAIGSHVTEMSIVQDLSESPQRSSIATVSKARESVTAELPIVQDFPERSELGPNATASKPERQRIIRMSITPVDHPEYSEFYPDDATVLKLDEAETVSVSSSSVLYSSESLPSVSSSSNKSAPSQSPSDKRSTSAPDIVDLPEPLPETGSSREESHTQSSSETSPTSESVSVKTLRTLGDTRSIDKQGTLSESSSSVDTLPESSASELGSESSVAPTTFYPSISSVSTMLSPVQTTATEAGSSETPAPSSNSVPSLAMKTSSESGSSIETLPDTEPAPVNSEATDPSFKENLPEE